MLLDAYFTVTTEKQCDKVQPKVQPKEDSNDGHDGHDGPVLDDHDVALAEWEMGPQQHADEDDNNMDGAELDYDNDDDFISSLSKTTAKTVVVTRTRPQSKNKQTEFVGPLLRFDDTDIDF